MKAHRLTRDERLEEVEMLRDSLREDIQKVSSLYSSDRSIPLDAVMRFNDLESKMEAKSLEDLTEKELITYHRDLEYISNLKSSSPEGALEASKDWTPIKDWLDSTSEYKRKKFWQAYDKIYSSGSTSLGYKYTAMEFITEAMGKMDTSTGKRMYSSGIANAFIDAFEQAQMIGGGEMSDEEIRAIFEDILSSRLQL